MKDVVARVWRCYEKEMNFGELLLYDILAHFDMQLVCWDPKNSYRAVTLIIGSGFHTVVVESLLKNSEKIYVIGQGNQMGHTKAIDMQSQRYKNRIEILALRGPLTKTISNFKGDVPLLDPGFLMPSILSMKINTGKDVWYIPHNSNMDKNVKERMRLLGANQYGRIFMPRENLHSYLNDLSSAGFVLTNTLHIYIVCLAYGIPTAISLLPDEDMPCLCKFLDVAYSLNIPLAIVDSADSGKRWWENNKYSIPSVQPLMAAFEKLNTISFEKNKAIRQL